MKNSSVRLLICAGGTGGGVYPALAVLQALNNDPQLDGSQSIQGSRVNLETLWVGGIGGMEVELVRRAAVDFQAIPAAGVHGVGLRALPGNTYQLVRGYRHSKRILSSFNPDVLFFTGGYIAVPMALAGRRYTSVVYTPDIEPGLALKTIARYADRIAVSVEGSRAYYKDQEKVMVTGYPTRPDLTNWSYEQALYEFDLNENIPVLLVFGGSRGARSINHALLNVLAELLEEVQIIHISGKLDWDEVAGAKEALNEEKQSRYQVYPYLHDRMGAALRAADLVLSRAGASVLGEFPAFALPAILVPYPHAWRYQRVNALYLADRNAAIMVEDGSLPDELAPQVLGLIRDRERLEEMSQAMAGLADPDAASKIAASLIDLARTARTKRM